MIDQAKQQQLQQFIQAKQLEWSQIAFGRRWDVESLANELASDARFAKLSLCGFWYGPTETEIRNILSPILAYAGYGPDLAVVSAAIALICHRHRIASNPIIRIVDGIAGAIGKRGS